MAAVYDRRLAGSETNSVFSILIPKSVNSQTKWNISRLNSLNVEISGSGWTVKEVKKDRLIISGPLVAGEMVLVESLK
jgi:hypothetical protein